MHRAGFRDLVHGVCSVADSRIWTSSPLLLRVIELLLPTAHFACVVLEVPDGIRNPRQSDSALLAKGLIKADPADLIDPRHGHFSSALERPRHPSPFQVAAERLGSHAWVQTRRGARGAYR